MSVFTGTVASLQRSRGGVPKLPVERAAVGVNGMEGDKQGNLRYHGGPDRALCLFSKDLIDALAAEGHPISPGATGENVTIAGIDWREMTPGVRLRLGTVDAELVSYAAPCRKIGGAFARGAFVRVSEKVHPGWSRVYVRILREGTIAVGDPVELLTLDAS